MSSSGHVLSLHFPKTILEEHGGRIIATDFLKFCYPALETKFVQRPLLFAPRNFVRLSY
jgi:hypothetical protein